MDQENNKERPLTTKEAAKLLGVTSRTIVRWIDAGRFPGAFKLNPRAYAIPKNEVENLVSEREK